MHTEHDRNIPMFTVDNTHQKSQFSPTISSSLPNQSTIRQEQRQEQRQEHEYEQEEQRQESVPPSNTVNTPIVPLIPHITRIPSLKKEPGVVSQPSMLITSMATSTCSTSSTCSSRSTTSEVLNHNTKRRKTNSMGITDNMIGTNNASFISENNSDNNNNNITNNVPTVMDMEVETTVTINMWAKILLLLDNFENCGILTPVESSKSRGLVYKQNGGLNILFNAYVKPNIIDYTIFVQRLKELLQIERDI